MAEKKIGKQTVTFDTCPYIIGSAAVVGKKEGEGPLRDSFDMILEDSPSFLYSIAGATIELAKPLMGTITPAPANFAILSNFHGFTSE